MQEKPDELKINPDEQKPVCAKDLFLISTKFGDPKEIKAAAHRLEEIWRSIENNCSYLN